MKDDADRLRDILEAIRQVQKQATRGRGPHGGQVETQGHPPGHGVSLDQCLCLDCVPCVGSMAAMVRQEASSFSATK